ncbi:MATE family efflux transporter [uncultured Neglectibacter sp.]|uniref:MATE family efflux transporter n=1 Tax=uncultured Neglectibacter sp. TaxID=1924108 RepID=UPI0034DF5BB7
MRRLFGRKGSRGTYEIDMTHGPLLGKIVKFAIPLAVSGVLQLLFNAADIVVVGRFAGSTALAAVGSTGALINLIVTLFMGLSVGTNVLVAQYYGAGNQKELSETVHTSILASVVFGIGLIFIGIGLARPVLEAMATPPEVLDQAVLYMRIYFIGMPGMMLYNFGAAVLRAVGDTQRPLYFLLLAGIINVLLNLFFVIQLHMGVAGVAAATSISQAISAGLVLWCLVKADSIYRVDLRRLCIKKDKLLKMAKIGLPAGIQGASFSISNVLIQSTINSFGSVAMAGNTAAANIEGFVSTAMDAFSQAAMSFTGQNVGAKKLNRVNRILVLCLSLGVGIGLLMGIGAYFAGSSLLSIYSSDPEVISFGLRRLAIVCACQCVGALMGNMVGVLRGLGASFVPMVITITFVCGFRVVWLYTVFAMAPTLETLYWSYPITWALAAAFDFICYFIVKKRLAKKLGIGTEPQTE